MASAALDLYLHNWVRAGKPPVDAIATAAP
jgi:hypothetical protein